MAETAHNPETGQFAVREPGRGWRVVDQETYDQARRDSAASDQGVVGSFAREIGSQVVDDVGGAVEALGGGGLFGAGLSMLAGQYPATQRPGSVQESMREVGQSIQTSNDAQQQARYREMPGIGAAAVGAQMLVPAGVPGAKLVRGARASDAMPAATQPMTRRFVETADAVVDRSRARAGRTRGPWEAQGGRQSVGARANPDAPAAPDERVLNGMLTPEEMDSLANDLDLGNVMTRGDRAALRARVDTDEIQRADAARSAEELGRSNMITDRARGGVNEARDNAQNAATRLVMNELGEGRGQRLTSENMRRMVAQSQQIFERAAQEAGDIPIQNMKYAQLQDIADDVGADDYAIVQRFIDNISKDAKENGDVLPNRLVRDYRSKLGRSAQRAAAGDNFERSMALRDVQEWLDRLVDERVSGETREALQEARYRWRIIRALESSSASTDAAGKVNLPSFTRSYQRAGNRFFKSTGKEGARGQDFGRALETFRFLTAKVEPDSGTAGRVIHNLANRVPFASGGG